MISAIDQHLAHAGIAHLAEGDLLRIGRHGRGLHRYPQGLIGIHIFFRSRIVTRSRHKCEHISRTSLIYLGISGRLTPLRRECRIASAEPVCSCALFFVQHCTRDRGCSAHPAFPAPFLLSRERPYANPRAISAARMRRYVWKWQRKHHTLAVIARLDLVKPGDPVRRGFSVLSLTSLEYWIARSSRATTCRSE
jgi:hypothetical protein